nr:3-phosphoglycerate dehydrogenase [Actinomycetota bacterium]NIS34400.1 3-phosphoglycerate dehydrogenase [Actinomycetota bacterium]NIT97451.1 3-phosphoglycerate dehydrogenase [Actinomycetota bacterium]NIU21123.1 3-phosphoglycerate dehydrogenase [Actinomycetota bacterium]NIU69176.1 3-phosphoglycerate dehydrogenase [Actinomycetota bacterium]
FGRIARRVAGAGIGLGMRVRVYDPYVKHNGFPSSVTRETELAALLAAADVVSVHVPLSDETRRMFDADAFAAMKPGSVFINTARGGLVDQDALLGALEEGRLFGAGLDVTEPEPLPPEHPLLHRPDVIVTPHVASGTQEGKRRIFRTTIAQVIHVLNGERPPHLVNPEVWDTVATRVAADGGA